MKKKTKVLLGIVFTISILGNCMTLITSYKPIKKSKNIVAMYLENEDGGYDLSNQTSFPTDGYVLNTEKSLCNNGGTISQDSESKKLSVSVSNKDECTVYFDKVKAPTSSSILAHLKQSSNGVKTNFDDSATTDEGIFEMEDDYGTSYYFRGAVENNYIKYGRNSSGQEMWWRIIRINGDASLRIIYDGTQGYANGIQNNDRAVKVNQTFQTASLNKDPKFVGWMYGTEGAVASTSKEEAQRNVVDSEIKKVTDVWYKENIVDTGFSGNVSDEIFCNDRSTGRSGFTNDTGLGYGNNDTYYGITIRMRYSSSSSQYRGASPTFICPQKNDAFTVSDIEKGNGALTYPVGLITTDEVVAAGSGKYASTNEQLYLCKKKNYWTMTPVMITKFSSFIAQMGVLIDTGAFGGNWVSAVYDLVPVINLSPEFASTLIGTGTITDPYRAP